ncbi:hypothetical protein BIV60_18580 [Bacillus sp. MUM 116]|uniref:UPF0738 family protein n=1 Tax=Bacillus sp. MUM 116 TaxID=1678002 RepID=UPI0008F55E33|nr:hypothetical protein [Bacillus sp. MUM 116]OIK11160.1 hypothetical protein BIV60_18580 [Bacillus sp. MUM 116]
MKNKLTAINGKIIENQIVFTVNEAIHHLQPAEQILVDSDNLSFIYLMEDKEEYAYIAFPEETWEFLKTAVENKLSVYLSFNDQQIELPQFTEELEYIISNIKGNGNYGDEMVTKVEENF